MAIGSTMSPERILTSAKITGTPNAAVTTKISAVERT